MTRALSVLAAFAFLFAGQARPIGDSLAVPSQQVLHPPSPHGGRKVVPPEERDLALAALEVPIADEERLREFLDLVFNHFPGIILPSHSPVVVEGSPHSAPAGALKVVGLPAVPRLRKFLTHRDPRTRRLVIQTLAEIGDDSAIPDMAHTLHDSDPAVRAAAAYALGAFRATEALPSLLRARLDDDPSVRRAVAYSLGAMRLSEVLPALVELLSDPDPHVRRMAIRAVEGVGCAEAVPGLIPLLEDPDGAVRFNAATALRTLTFGIVTATRLPYYAKAGFKRRLDDHAQAYREFWRTHKGMPNDQLMREAVDLRLSLLTPENRRQAHQELYRPLEQIAFQRFSRRSQEPESVLLDKWKHWWAGNRDRETWEWALQSGQPGHANAEDVVWALVVREGGAQPIPRLVALAEAGTRDSYAVVQLLKHLTLLDLGFGQDWPTDETRQAAAQAWREWYAKYGPTWDVKKEMQKALPSARGEDFWIAAKTLRWLGDYSAAPVLLQRLKSSDSAEYRPAREELQRLTGRRVAYNLHPWQSHVQHQNLVANWRLWWERNADRIKKRPPPLPRPRMWSGF